MWHQLGRSVGTSRDNEKLEEDEAGQNMYTPFRVNPSQRSLAAFL